MNLKPLHADADVVELKDRAKTNLVVGAEGSRRGGRACRIPGGCARTIDDLRLAQGKTIAVNRQAGDGNLGPGAVRIERCDLAANAESRELQRRAVDHDQRIARAALDVVFDLDAAGGGDEEVRHLHPQLSDRDAEVTRDRKRRHRERIRQVDLGRNVERSQHARERGRESALRLLRAGRGRSCAAAKIHAGRIDAQGQRDADLAFLESKVGDAERRIDQDDRSQREFTSGAGKIRGACLDGEGLLGLDVGDGTAPLDRNDREPFVRC